MRINFFTLIRGCWHFSSIPTPRGVFAGSMDSADTLRGVGVARLIEKLSTNFRTFFFAILFITTANTCAGTMGATHNNEWRAFAAFGAGTTIGTSVGKSQTFPLLDINEGFYIYTATNRTQSRFLLDGFFGLEWAFRPTWLVEIGLDYNQSDTFSPRGNVLQGIDVQTAGLWNYRYNMVVRQLLLESKLLYTWTEYCHPYVLAGLGASFNRANNYSVAIPPFIGFSREYIPGNASSFSYALGVGIDEQITPQVRIGLGYRFTDFGRVSLGTSIINYSQVYGTLNQAHFYANQVLSQLTFIF